MTDDTTTNRSEETLEALEKLGIIGAEEQEEVFLYEKMIKPGDENYKLMEDNVKFILPMLNKQDKFVAFLTLWNSLSIFLETEYENGYVFEINGKVARLPDIKQFSVLVDSGKVNTNGNMEE